MFDLIDLTQPLTTESLSYPGDCPAYRAEIVDIGEPGVQLTHFAGFDPHAGTHLDAPLHFDPTGADLARVPLRILPACIVRVPRDRIARDDIPQDIAGAAVLFSTGWEHRAGTRDYFSGFPYLTEAASHALVEGDAGLVGLDAPSVDPPDGSSYPAHRTLCEAGIPIVEGLVNLESLAELDRPIHFLAFPLRIVGGEGSPVRAVALVERS